MGNDYIIRLSAVVGVFLLAVALTITTLATNSEKPQASPSTPEFTPISASSGNAHQLASRIIDSIRHLAGDTFAVNVSPDHTEVQVLIPQEKLALLTDAELLEIGKRADLGGSVEIRVWDEVPEINGVWW